MNALDFGTVWVNEHFVLGRDVARRLGGVRLGEEGSAFSLEDYTRVKHAMINLA